MATDPRTVLKLRVPLIVQIGRRKMALTDVLGLGPGAIIELSKSADEPLDLRINNKRIGAGRAAKVGENFGVRIKGIGTRRQRLAALAGEQENSPSNHEPST